MCVQPHACPHPPKLPPSAGPTQPRATSHKARTCDRRCASPRAIRPRRLGARHLAHLQHKTRSAEGGSGGNGAARIGEPAIMRGASCGGAVRRRGPAAPQTQADMRAGLVRLQVCGCRVRLRAWVRGLQLTCMSLQLVTFRHLDGERSPYFLRARHPRAWGAARSSNLMSLKEVR